MDIITNVLFIVAGIIAAASFICFLLAIFTSQWVNHFPESSTKDAMVKWNIRFNFVKNVCWQWLIYLFSVTCLIYLGLNLL